ncbi:MAG TPA: N-acetyltransferase [Dehalococcoidia bacterium]|nr:N-acetyltransferase [Dehalococcoidia bacterium]
MLPDVSLMPPGREDIQRMADWLADNEVNSFWYGRGDDGIALHHGYSPQRVIGSSEDEWKRIFEDHDRRIYAIYTQDGQHIGEGQLVIDWPLQEAQIFILIGRKDLWHHHYGTMGLILLLDEAYNTFELHRVWADIPEYNEHALQMFRQIGFVLEGHLRKTHPKDGEWYDSLAMGLLTDEYVRRRSRVMGGSA